jgi:hypothetical protein
MKIMTNTESSRLLLYNMAITFEYKHKKEG